MKYTIEYLKNNKVAVHCETKEESDFLLGYFHKHNIIWGSGDDLLDWEEWNKLSTCYELLSMNGDLQISTKAYWLGRGYSIITLAEFNGDIAATPATYTLEEVTEIARKVWEQAQISQMKPFTTDLIGVTAYETFEDYLKENPIKK